MKRRIGSVLLCSLVVALRVAADLPAVNVTPVNTPSSFVSSMTVGPDGAIWFVTSDAVGRTTIGGTATSFPVPTANPGLSQITTGPDGNLWFVESNANKIGKMTTSGAVTEYPFTGISFPGAFVAGPDGNLWMFGFVGIRGGIAKFSTSGASAGTINLPGNAGGVKLAPGPGNAMWFHDRTGNAVGYITSGGAVQSFPFSTADAAGGLNAAGGLAQGGDGNMWVAHSASIARVTPAGVITEYAVPGGGVIGPVAASPDGNIWFGDHQTSKIGRVLVSTATDRSVTIDQGASGTPGPTQMIFLTSTGGALRRAPLATDPCSAGSTYKFVIRTDPSVPPYIWYGTIETAPQKCADISVEVAGSEPTGLRILGAALTSEITVIVTNNGPNPATPSVTVTIAGDGYSDKTPDFIVHDAKAYCDEVSGGGKASSSWIFKCTASTQIGTGEIGKVTADYAGATRNVTVSAVATSDLADQKPSNNAASAALDLALGKVTPLSTTDQPLANVTKRR